MASRAEEVISLADWLDCGGGVISLGGYVPACTTKARLWQSMDVLDGADLDAGFDSGGRGLT